MERREPTLSTSSAPLPEREESPRPRKAAAEMARPRPPAASTSNGVAVFALLLALAGIGLGGAFGWQLFETKAQLTSADARIAELESRLSMTSDESSQSLTQVDAKLKWVDSEIRKLWGVSNDVNRKAINANGEKITGLSKELASIKKIATDAKTTSDKLQPQLAASKTAVEASLVKVDSAVSGIAEQRKRIQDLTEQVDRAEAQLVNLRSLEAKARTNEEAIAAIDAYRRALNRDILQIKQQLGMVPAG